MCGEGGGGSDRWSILPHKTSWTVGAGGPLMSLSWTFDCLSECATSCDIFRTGELSYRTDGSSRGVDKAGDGFPCDF